MRVIEMNIADKCEEFYHFKLSKLVENIRNS